MVSFLLLGNDSALAYLSDFMQSIIVTFHLPSYFNLYFMQSSEMIQFLAASAQFHSSGSKDLTKNSGF